LACARRIEQEQIESATGATLLHQAGVALRDRVLYVQAETLLTRALAIREKLSGAEHPETLASRGALAELYFLMGEDAAAEPLFKRAAEASGRLLGSDHSETTRYLFSLAKLYDRQNRFDLADPLYERIVTLRERALGRQHPLVADTLNALADTY